MIDFRTSIVAAAMVAAAPSPAAAQQEIALPAFEQVELRGGGRVVVRHGPAQRVRLIHGSRQVTGFAVDREGRLRIDACRASCSNYRLEVEIVTPRVAALSVRGGGDIDAAGGFPAQQSVAAAVAGGGAIDLRAMNAAGVAAAVSGGGQILAQPRRTLVAAVRGGGLVRYWGDPQVTQRVSGGGSVERARR